jgi:hypothetical protein
MKLFGNKKKAISTDGKSANVEVMNKKSMNTATGGAGKFALEIDGGPSVVAPAPTKNS